MPRRTAPPRGPASKVKLEALWDNLCQGWTKVIAPLLPAAAVDLDRLGKHAPGVDDYT